MSEVRHVFSSTSRARGTSCSYASRNARACALTSAWVAVSEPATARAWSNSRRNTPKSMLPYRSSLSTPVVHARSRQPRWMTNSFSSMKVSVSLHRARAARTALSNSWSRSPKSSGSANVVECR